MLRSILFVFQGLGFQLESMQKIVDGYIQAIYPFEDEELALICNEEGKLIGLPLNRALRDENDTIYDVLVGTFFMCRAPIDSDRFASLTNEQINFCKTKFGKIEMFFN